MEKITNYISPQIEMIDVKIEKGFAESLTEDPTGVWDS